MGVVLCLLFVSFQAVAIDRNELKKTLLAPKNFSLGYAVITRTENDKYTLEILRENMKKDAQNPFWFYLYAERVSLNKTESPNSYLLVADKLYTELEKQRKLTSGEIVVWSMVIERLYGAERRIRLIQERINSVVDAKQKLFQCLSDAYAKKVLEPFRVKGDVSNISTFIYNVFRKYSFIKRDYTFDINTIEEQYRISNDYFMKAIGSPQFSPNDYVGQDEAETSLYMVKMLIEALTIAEKNINKTDEEIYSLVTSHTSKLSAEYLNNKNNYRFKLNEQQAKTDPKTQAALIFFELIKGSSNSLSFVQQDAVALARSKYQLMIKDSRTMAYGYDGLVLLDCISHSINRKTLDMAEKALDLDITSRNAFAVTAIGEIAQADLSPIILKAKRKADIDHSLSAYLVLLCAYIIKSDAKSAELVLNEIKPYYEEYTPTDRLKLDIAIGAADILNDRFQKAVDLLYLTVQKIAINDSDRVANLYNLAVAMYLANLKERALYCLDNLDVLGDKDVAIKSKVLRAQIKQDQSPSFNIK